jgi:hypothetical protein
MRHSEIKLTAKVYTDETQLPIYDAIKGLPRLSGYTHARPQIVGPAKPDLAKVVKGWPRPSQPFKVVILSSLRLPKHKGTTSR